MVRTPRVPLDRVASSTRNLRLGPEVIVGDDIVPAEGYVLAVRILTDKSSYNTVEDVSGRMMSVRSGDVLAGTLGSRRALRGYAGDRHFEHGAMLGEARARAEVVRSDGRQAA